MAETQPKVKLKRPDRKKKLQDRKYNIETVVKACLLKSLEEPKILEAIENRVRQFSESRKFACLSLSHYIKELFQGVEDLSTINITEEILDQTFIRQLMLGTSEARLPTLAKNILSEHPKYDPSEIIKRFPGDRNIYCAGASKYLTNLKTGLRFNFAKRILSFTKSYASSASLTDNERKGIFYQICGWNIPSSFGPIFPNRLEVSELISNHRRILELENKIEVTKDWIKDETTLLKLLKYNVFLNREIERVGGKVFNIVPIAGYKPSFITIDTSVLYGIAKELDLVSCNETAFKCLREEHWRSFFKIPKYEGGTNKFTGTIETDGVSVCFHFKRPKTLNDDIQTKFEKNQHEIVNGLLESFQEDVRFVGYDPGRTNIGCAAEVLKDGTIRTFNLSRGEYYNSSGMFKARKKTKTWSKCIQEQLKSLSEVTTKGCDLTKHNAFVVTFLQVREAVTEEYFKKRWRRQKLRLYGGKKRTFDNFFNKIRNADPEKKVILAYGAAKFAPGGQNEISVPTERAFKEAKKHFTVIPTDEFRTSRVFNVTDTLLESVKSKKRDTVLRGLLWNRSPTSKFVNRDANAALNIRRCITTPTRPLSLTRDNPNLPPLLTKCGIVIKF